MSPSLPVVLSARPCSAGRAGSAGARHGLSNILARAGEPVGKSCLVLAEKLTWLECQNCSLSPPHNTLLKTNYIESSGVSFRLEIKIPVKSLIPSRSEVYLESKTSQNRENREKELEVSVTGHSHPSELVSK